VKPLSQEAAVENVRSRRGIIDRIWRALGSQLRNPTGPAGSIAGWLMALVNDEPNRLAIDALDLARGERVLELGFGPGWSLRTIAARTRTRVYGIDQSARMLEQATHMNEVAVSSGRMVLVRGPFSPLPWIDEMFDKVLLVNVVYFFDLAGRDIAEVYRVLRSGGRVVIYATSRNTMQKWPFAGLNTHRTFDAHDLRNLLEIAGFRPSDIKITYAELALGVKGLIAVAEKTDGPIRRDKIAQGRAGCSIIRFDVSGGRPVRNLPPR
jgi:SAM-dependent methyltransferase